MRLNLGHILLLRLRRAHLLLRDLAPGIVLGLALQPPLKSKKVSNSAYTRARGYSGAILDPSVWKSRLSGDRSFWGDQA